jgi:hypothetical protein
MMNCLLTILLIFCASSYADRAQQSSSPPLTQTKQQPTQSSGSTNQSGKAQGASAAAASAGAPQQPVRVMSDYRGVKLGMKQSEVDAVMGKAELKASDKERFVLKGDDRLTVYYDNGAVKAIQLYITDPKRAPSWNEVVGDAEVVQLDHGAKHARQLVSDGGYWVSMYQNKEGTVTTVTISR